MRMKRSQSFGRLTENGLSVRRTALPPGCVAAVAAEIGFLAFV